MEVLIIAIVFSVPLAAIVGAYWVRVRKMELDARGGPEQDARLRALEAENRDLRQRVETLETIVTSDSPRTKVRVQTSSPAATDDEVEVERRPGAEKAKA